jgi:predicted transporter
MVISMAAFSVKTGVGWAYLWLREKPAKGFLSRAGRISFLIPLFAILAGYGALFAGAYLLVTRVNILERLDVILPMLRGGVTLHWITALAIFVWGVTLLRSGDCHRGGGGVLALIIPCPVCMSVILMSAGGLALYFPEAAAVSIAGLYAAFAVISLASGAIMIAGDRRDPGSAVPALGMGMMLIAAYFIISALVMPQFADIDRIYRMASYARENGGSDPKAAALTLCAIVGLLGAGFLYKKNALRGKGGIAKKTGTKASEALNQ